MFSTNNKADDIVKYGLSDMRVMNNGDIYLIFITEDDKEDSGGISAIKKYCKRK